MNPEYPIFSGQVVKVGPIVSSGTETRTVIQYLEGLDEVSLKDIMSGMIPFLREQDPDHVPLEDRMKVANIPMHIDPSVLNMAEVRTRFSKFKTDEGEVKCYELEIIKGPAGSYGAFDGLRYIKVIGE